MNNSDINKALKSMGYRQPDLAQSERWCKPLGYSMIICDVKDDKFILSQLMMAYPTKPKLTTWVSSEKELRTDKTVDNYINEICSFEEWELKECSPPVLQRFAFLTKLESVESFCGL